MTLNGITRRLRPGSLVPSGSDGLIGTADNRTFSCPGCARPLAVGQGRCPGCGGWLVAGVLFRTALFLILVGCVVGLIGGALIAGIAMAGRLEAGDAARAALAATAAATPAPVAGSSVAPAAPGVAAPSVAAPSTVSLPPGTAAAVAGMAAANERLARSADALRAVLADRHPDANEIAPLLRKVAADVRSAEGAGRTLAAWAPGTATASDTGSVYMAAAEAAADGLAAALADDDAYVAAARRLLSALDPLAQADAALRALALRAGVSLPGASTAP